MDDIVFRKPVNSGDTLNFIARVTYTQECYIQVKVEIKVLKYNQSYTSNTMHFSFRTLDESNVFKIIPPAYSDGMLYLNGRRHLLKALQHKRI